jgi:hypothetical protein
MAATSGRQPARELDPRVAVELERAARIGDGTSVRAGHGPHRRLPQSEARDVQRPPRPARDERSAAAYKDRAQPRDDAVEDGG